MNLRLLIASAMVLAAPLAHAQSPDLLWYTTNNVLVPPQPYAPQIDALSFVCDKKFILNTNYGYSALGGGGYFYYGSQAVPYSTSSTLNWTNKNGGTLTSLTGFDFQTWDDNGPRMAANFFNDVTATINVATNGGSYYLPFFSSYSGGYYYGSYGSSAQCLISATNVFNRGSINMGTDTLLSIAGERVDLARSSLSMEGYTTTGFFSSAAGMSDGYWGTGNNLLQPIYDFEVPPSWTPYHTVTNRNLFLESQRLVFPNYNFYLSDMPIGTNRSLLAVFLNNPNPTVTNKVYFFNNADEILVEWSWQTTNGTTGVRETNYLTLWDYPTGTNNVQYNGVYGGWFTYIPSCFTFARSTFPYVIGTAAPTNSPLGVFDPGSVTNQFAAYEAIFEANTSSTGDILGQNELNLPGRIEITASQNLDLFKTRMNAGNSISISATNHFSGSGQATISAPYLALNLGSTNGTLILSNTVVPALAQPEGSIRLYSSRWNTVTGQSNQFHVLFVDSQFSGFTRPVCVNVGLRATNVFISDALNIRSNFMVEAQNLTLTANAPGSPTPYGEVNLLSSLIPNWQYLTPLLRNLTNWGVISSPNIDNFVGYRTPPYSPSTYTEPYQSFLNHGAITNTGTIIWADFFANSGVVNVGPGSISLSAGSAYLTNGQFLAQQGAIDLSADRLIISNHTITAGSALTFGATSLIDDGSLTQSVATVTNKNSWNCGFGFNLSALPAASSLLGTTITDSIPAQLNIDVPHSWAGLDRGVSASGYSNNCAVGRLVLNGSVPCTATFTGAGTTNALYVDSLELFGVFTNRDSGGNIPDLVIAPNMVIYYAQARMNGVSVAVKLNHRNNNRLRWVSSYAGYYSSTNLVYPDGNTYSFNAALAASCDFDSNNNGIANCSDPAPFFVSSQLNFGVAVTNTPPRQAVLAWNTIGKSTNTVFFTTNLVAPNWQTLTQFVAGSANSRLSILDPVGRTDRFYRVNVQVPQP